MMKFTRPLLLLVVLVVTLRLDAAPENNATATTDLRSLSNASPAQLKAFFNSKAYKDRHTSDAEFVKDVFNAVLQRDPDPTGLENWLASLKRTANEPNARARAVENVLKSAEYRGRHAAAPAPVIKKKDTTRLAGNVLFNETGVFVNDPMALPPDRYIPLFKKAHITWLSLQIDNGGKAREDNVASIERGWADAWRRAGFKVGFWGCARGVMKHNDTNAIAESTRQVQADAQLAVKLIAQCHGEFYFADCEDGYQSWGPSDPAPVLNRVYVEAFEKAAAAVGLAKLPRALSSMGRVGLDMAPWIDAGWDALPQAYWNSYAVYQPSKCIDFYLSTGWPIARIHPTIATYPGEGENRKVTLEEYAADLKTRATAGFSYYLPESYLRFDNSAPYEQIARMGGH